MELFLIITHANNVCGVYETLDKAVAGYVELIRASSIGRSSQTLLTLLETKSPRIVSIPMGSCWEFGRVFRDLITTYEDATQSVLAIVREEYGGE